MLEERQIVEDAITEFDSVLAEQLSSDLSVDTSRLIYWTWGVTAAVLVVLIMIYAMAPKMGGVVKGEITSIFVIVSCIVLLTTFLGKSHFILPTCIMIVFLVLYYLYRRGKSGGGSSVPDVGSVVAPAAV
jgi:4-amino-4-deoxy-L-arabinose transferase-like glycosyltransferase